MTRARHPYVDLVSKRASPEASAWFVTRHAELARGTFGAAYAGAGRRLGMVPFEPDGDEARELTERGLLVPRGWPLSGIGRGALLIEMCARLDPSEHVAFIEHLFRTGDNAEREAVLRTLSLLPAPERFVAVAIDACRSSVQSVFEAIACENPYPARYFPELSFNQLVLKAFFTEVAVRRIDCLSKRLSPELARMAEGYASERRAAGRSVPADLGVVTGADGTDGPGPTGDAARRPQN